MCRTSIDTPRSGGSGTVPPMSAHVATQPSLQKVVYAILAGMIQRHADKERPRHGTRTCFLSAERRGPGTGHPSNRLCHPESKRRGRSHSTPLISRSAEPTTHKAKRSRFCRCRGHTSTSQQIVSVAIAVFAISFENFLTVGRAHPSACHKSHLFYTSVRLMHKGRLTQSHSHQRLPRRCSYHSRSSSFQRQRPRTHCP